MSPLPVVKHFHVIEQAEPRIVAGLVVAVHDQFGLERMEEALHRRVDAPMSSLANGIRQIRQDQRVQLANDVPLKATLNLFRGQSLSSSASDVRTRPRIAPHTNHRDRPQGIISGSIASPVKAM